MVQFRKFITPIKNNEIALDLARTFIVRVIAALGTFVFGIVLGRLYGSEGLGVFALAQSLILGAGIFARYGTDNSLMRFVGQNHQSSQIWIFLRWAIKKAASLSIPIAVLLFLGRNYFERIFEANGLGTVLIGISIATPAFTMAFVLSGFMKGVRKPASACLLENGFVSLIAGILNLLLQWLNPDAGVSNAGWSFALAAWMVLGYGVAQIWAWQKNYFLLVAEMGAVISHSEFKNSSNAFFVTSMANFMQAVLGMMIAGLLLPSSDLGLFKAAQQSAILISLILVVINAVFPPRFAALFHQGNYEALNKLVRQGALIGIALALPVLMLFLFVPQVALGLFGKEFLKAAHLLQIIAIGQLINVATGSVGLLLNMTGHERLMRNISLSCNTLGLFLFFLLIPLFGATGAAMALALVIVMQNLTATLFVWLRLGIWVLPVYNFLKRLGINTTIVK